MEDKVYMTFVTFYCFIFNFLKHEFDFFSRKYKIRMCVKLSWHDVVKFVIMFVMICKDFSSLLNFKYSFFDKEAKSHAGCFLIKLTNFISSMAIPRYKPVFLLMESTYPY